MQIHSHRVFIQIHLGVWAIRIPCVAKQCLSSRILPAFPLLFFFFFLNITACAVTEGASSVYKLRWLAGQSETASSRRQIFALENNF